MLVNRCRTSYVDRRRSERLVCNRLAKLHFQYGRLPRDCMITDVSEIGVQVIAEDCDMPAEFTVIFSTGHSRRCRLQWQNGYEFGAAYVDNSDGRTSGDVIAHAR
jgi:hypothetical protein